MFKLCPFSECSQKEMIQIRHCIMWCLSLICLITGMSLIRDFAVCMREESLDPHVPIECTAKTLMGGALA